jgi:hypothetical protein
VEGIRRYLLHDCPEDEAFAFEERYFGDPQRLDEIQDVEAELLDEYVRGRLAETDRLLLERHYLDSPARRERVAFARALAAVIDADREKHGSRPRTVPVRRQSWSAYALPIAVSVLLAVLTLGLLAERARLRGELDGLAAETERLRASARQAAEQLTAEQRRSEALAATIERLRAAAPSAGSVPGLFVVLLSPLLRDASEPDALTWPTSAAEIELRLGGDLGRYAGYRVAIDKEGADAVWVGDGRRIALPHGEGVAVRLPAARLPPGRYVVTLRGASRDGARDDLHRYSFVVAR